MSPKNPIQKQHVLVIIRNLKISIKQKHWQEVQQLLEQMHLEAPLSIETLGLEFEYFIRSEQYETAKLKEKQLISLFPTSSKLFFLRGLLSYKLKDYTSAIVHFQESHYIHPHWSSARWLGKAFTQSSQFNEAQSVLLPLCQSHPVCHLDLAWLHERQNQQQDAQKHLQTYLTINPKDNYANSTLNRLRARQLAPGEMLEQVKVLEELGEKIPEKLQALHLENLLKTAQLTAARKLVETQKKQMSDKIKVELAWVAYQYKSYDLAFTLFFETLEHHANNYKLLRALENAAVQVAQLDKLQEKYLELAPTIKTFYGRIKKLPQQ
ncbi:MAG: hypothetical protein GXP14_10775 [Gammaproteobacteria bacterium]|nr:hypothetical protein [Gammaproteobacteria bacterium]